MEQLTGLDAAFLALDTPRTTGHVGSIQVVEALDAAGERVTLDRLTAVVGDRLHLVPPMRRKIVEVPLGLGQPFWVEDADFDLEFHVRELALPAPGSMHQLTEQVARIHARTLDRSRPLWEIYLIHGLEGDRAAIYSKVHHAMIDGVGGQEIAAALLDLSPEGREIPPAPPWDPDPAPGSLTLLAKAAASLATVPTTAGRFAADVARSAPALLSIALPRLPGVDLVSAVANRLAEEASGSGLGAVLPGGLGIGDGGLLEHVPGRAPATPFNRNVSAHRRIALRSVPLDVVKAVKSAAGMTVNDVVLAMCAGALRRWLSTHDALPEDPLVAAVPVSVRTSAAQGAKSGDGTFGNRVSLMLAVLPTDEPDPLTRMRVAHEATSVAKYQHDALSANLLADAYQFTMPALMGLTMRANARLRVLERASLFNLFVSNVPGPSVPLYLAGHRLLASYPVSAIADGQGLNITVLSYLGDLHFGLTADRDLVPDLDVLAGYLAEELEELARATGVAGAVERAVGEADGTPRGTARRPARAAGRRCTRTTWTPTTAALLPRSPGPATAARGPAPARPTPAPPATRTTGS
ncbi:wax ester/triacylglycerol synthase family O-acyltransferase [Kineosporia sp. A_224]|uniref:WS/DGAT/MGAT family O-acyltransferase n=1 Tax=Kineosporia sp. A_224 TaxID=1962180 RepID=UPI000B4A86D9|nr:wax ester/triacylglycerol synthase family O-acyltransferase [Kineosporia sp. A_224]